MKPDNPFDSRLENNQGIPADFRNALIDVADTLDFCVSIAESVFETKATPDHAIAICAIVMQQRNIQKDMALKSYLEQLEEIKKRQPDADLQPAMTRRKFSVVWKANHTVTATAIFRS